MRTQRLTLLALLTSVGLAIHVFEAILPPPLPLPGAKLGLANIVTLIALTHFSRHDALKVLLARIFLAGLFGGQLVSLMMSLAGGLSCYAASVVALRRAPLGLRTLSVIGAVAHNLGQLAMAAFIMHTAGIIFYLPFLLLMAIPAGLLTATAAELLIKHLGPSL